MVWWHRNLRIVLRNVGTKMQQNQRLCSSSAVFPVRSITMVWWHRNLRIVLRNVGTKMQQNQRLCSSSGQVLTCRQGSFPPTRSPVGSIYQYLQHSGIHSSAKLLAEVSTGLTPVSSPLTPVLSPTSSASRTSAVSKPSTVQAVLKDIRQSPKKVNLVAQLVRGMRVDDALLQLQVTVKRAAKTVHKVIKSARANASHNHGLDPDRLLVAEAFVGKGRYLKRISYHAKGRSGIMVRPHCRLTVVVRELTGEEEAKIAKLKVMNYKKLTKKERQLVPHQLIETMPRWSRKPQSEKLPEV